MVSSGRRLGNPITWGLSGMALAVFVLAFALPAVKSWVPATYWVRLDAVALSQIVAGQCPIVTIDREVRRTAPVNWILQLERLTKAGWSREGLKQDSGQIYLERSEPQTRNIPLDWPDCRGMQGSYRAHLRMQPVTPYANPGWQARISPPVTMEPGRWSP